jgi:hypothetical protein
MVAPVAEDSRARAHPTVLKVARAAGVRVHAQSAQHTPGEAVAA